MMMYIPMGMGTETETEQDRRMEAQEGTKVISCFHQLCLSLPLFTLLFFWTHPISKQTQSSGCSSNASYSINSECTSSSFHFILPFNSKKSKFLGPKKRTRWMGNFPSSCRRDIRKKRSRIFVKTVRCGLYVVSLTSTHRNFFFFRKPRFKLQLSPLYSLLPPEVFLPSHLSTLTSTEYLLLSTIICVASRYCTFDKGSESGVLGDLKKRFELIHKRIAAFVRQVSFLSRCFVSQISDFRV